MSVSMSARWMLPDSARPADTHTASSGRHTVILLWTRSGMRFHRRSAGWTAADSALRHVESTFGGYVLLRPSAGPVGRSAVTLVVGGPATGLIVGNAAAST